MSNIKHKISNVTVFYSDDYEMFTMIDGNRALDLNKINRIIDEIQSGNDMLKYYPIQVSVEGDKLKIIDGQHRFFICQKLQRTVHYILVSEPKSMIDIAKVNSNVARWQPKDFLNCYINQGITHYTRLQEFLNTYGIVISVSCMMLTSGAPYVTGSFSVPKQLFESGQFKVLQWDAAVELAEACMKFKPFQFWNERYFMTAIDRIIKAKKVPLQQIIDAYQKYPELLTRQPSQKLYVTKLEEILNHRKHNRTIII